MCITYDDRQLSLLRRLAVKKGVPHVPMRLRAGSALPAHEDVNMSGGMVVISIALANIAASDVVDFLNNEVATNGHT